MLSYKKRQLLSMISTLEKLNNDIRTAEGKTHAEIMDMLMQSQELAIAIGTDLETRGEIGQEKVGILEDYCENLYQQSISLQDDALYRKLSKKTRKQLVNVVNFIRYELPEDKKEAIFLPYKAAMWDSLESVWMALREYDEYDTYVIPIPYFDKNADGSFGKMHYEGDEYPDYVPVTSWEEYDIVSRHPEMIFIHNPYDNWNHVTSVHPDFYASKLKDYTDELVYIPYYIFAEIDPANQAAIDKMKQFCFVPGTIYSDRVIVQSEDMRQIYINEYMKAAQENQVPSNREYEERKFLGLGSPKLDKIWSTGKENTEFPEAWLEIMQKLDGGWKKVILYNTSVIAFLDHGERMLEKMEETFQLCRENRDEIALLWRPHPLIQNTLKSRLPALWTKYRDMEKKYRSDGWGIYDDVSDMDIAIAVSDMYYGDSSSVAELYRQTGKPVIIQSIPYRATSSSSCAPAPLGACVTGCPLGIH